MCMEDHVRTIGRHDGDAGKAGTRWTQQLNNWTGKTLTCSPCPQPLFIKLTWREIKKERERESVSQANGQWTKCRRLRNRFATLDPQTCPPCKDVAARRKAFTRLFPEQWMWPRALHVDCVYSGNKRIERIVTVLAMVSTITIYYTWEKGIKHHLDFFWSYLPLYLACIWYVFYWVSCDITVLAERLEVHRLSCCQTVLVGSCLNLKPEGQRVTASHFEAFLHSQWDANMIWENVKIHKKSLLFSLPFYWDVSEVAL